MDQGLQIIPSAGFAAWLARQGVSLAFTTYQAGKVFVVGLNDDGRLSIMERSFARSMGFAATPDGQTLWLASQFQLWRFANFLSDAPSADGYDAMYVPIEGRTVGEVDIHDIHPRADAPPLFIVARFNCIATLDDTNSFAPVWIPPFVDAVVAEDRCHLNGMAIEGDTARFVTCVAPTNVGGIWRDHRRDGGVVVDVASGETVARGLSMPHAPRLYRGRFYMIQSGTGEFGTLDPASGIFTPICDMQGFARGLTFVGTYAVLGVSEPRDARHFGGLDLQDRLAARGLDAVCQIAVVNLETGAIEESLTLKGIVRELYDVALLKGVRKPMIHGFKQPDLRFVIRPAPYDLDRQGGRET